MKKTVLLAAVCVGIPLHAAAQEAPKPPCTPAEAPARAALPARASTLPQPQQGSVAPSNRVPSEVVTPSVRAMRAARARQAERDGAHAADTPAAATDCQPASPQEEAKALPGRQ